jgi:DNA-binding transcriptional ArsR family regulator
MLGGVSRPAPRSDGPALARAAALFRALSSPVRLIAVSELAAGPRCVHELLGAMARAGRPVSQPLLSQHLRVLRDVGLVTTTRQANEVTYALADDHAARIVRDTLARSAPAPGGSTRALDQLVSAMPVQEASSVSKVPPPGGPPHVADGNR